MGNHRADRRGSEGAAEATTPGPAARAAGGRRRATRRETAAKPFRRIPAVPSILGAAALVAAAVGAVGLGQGHDPSSSGFQLSASAANSFSGTDAFNFTGDDPRSVAISRDSERQALQDALDKKAAVEVEEVAQQRDSELASLAASAQKRADQIAKNLWVLPTVGYHLTARFGQSSGLWAHLHTGLDFAAPTGTPIFAIANGVITFTGFDGSYGNKTVETLPDGTEIWYAHQSEIGVAVGQKVVQGSQIGRIGATGNVTGPHVHIEVRPGGGDPVDPYPAFIYHGVTP
jgi:murein DD-endopeptidase MepM/ murein hydrolase activator NlpD